MRAVCDNFLFPCLWHSLQDKTRELSELTDYYHSMLEAKETSIESLQQLMENQQRAHKQAEDLWQVWGCVG